MDEGDSRVLIEGGVLKIWDRQRHLLTRVQRIENQMYRLELQVARPLCLATHLGGGTNDLATPTSVRWRG
jgi:hypothetical protein